jgi:NhaP-type Na+/H+ or K+/H+ antiporter
MDVSRTQFACGAFAIVIPLLLIAGYYSQLLLDKLDQTRDLAIMTFVTFVALGGEAAALIGLQRPNRWCAGLSGLAAAISATGVVLVPAYAMRLRAQRRRQQAPPPPGPQWPPSEGRS